MLRRAGVLLGAAALALVAVRSLLQGDRSGLVGSFLGPALAAGRP